MDWCLRYTDNESELFFATKPLSRAGLVPATRRELHARLKPLIVDQCPFANLPESKSGRWEQGLTASKMKECIWVKPNQVWTDSALLPGDRHLGQLRSHNPQSMCPRCRLRRQVDYSYVEDSCGCLRHRRKQ
jgi:hypothetical protein